MNSKINKLFGISTRTRYVLTGMLIASLCMSTGCQALLATVLIAFGAHETKAKYKFFKGKKVAVACVSETLHDLRYDDVPRDLAKAVGMHLEQNVKKIEIVSPSKVNTWLVRHENRIEDPQKFAKDMEADFVMIIELASFQTSALSSPGSYQGRASTSFVVYDAKGKLQAAEALPEFVYPPNGRLSAGDTRESEFKKGYLVELSRMISCYFYSYNHRDNYAMDAKAGLSF